MPEPGEQPRSLNFGVKMMIAGALGALTSLGLCGASAVMQSRTLSNEFSTAGIVLFGASVLCLILGVLVAVVVAIARSR